MLTDIKGVDPSKKVMYSISYYDESNSYTGFNKCFGTRKEAQKLGRRCKVKGGSYKLSIIK